MFEAAQTYLAIANHMGTLYQCHKINVSSTFQVVNLQLDH